MHHHTVCAWSTIPWELELWCTPELNILEIIWRSPCIWQLNVLFMIVAWSSAGWLKFYAHLELNMLWFWNFHTLVLNEPRQSKAAMCRALCPGDPDAEHLVGFWVCFGSQHAAYCVYEMRSSMYTNLLGLCVCAAQHASMWVRLACTLEPHMLHNIFMAVTSASR